MSANGKRRKKRKQSHERHHDQPSLAQRLLDKYAERDRCPTHWLRAEVQAEIDQLLREHQRRMHYGNVRPWSDQGGQG